MGRRRGWHWSTRAERGEIRRRVARGERLDDVAVAVGRSKRHVQLVVAVRWDPAKANRSLTAPAFGRRSGRDQPRSARGRVPAPDRARARPGASTVSREVAATAAGGAIGRWPRSGPTAARVGRAAKLARNARLRRVVERLLRPRWSPQQIAWQLRHDHPHEPEMWVSPRDDLPVAVRAGPGCPAGRVDHAACEPVGRGGGRPAGPGPSGELAAMVLISERPAEVEDRAVPGHWEGDLIIGKGTRSAIGTLVSAGPASSCSSPCPTGGRPRRPDGPRRAGS